MYVFYQTKDAVPLSVYVQTRGRKRTTSSSPQTTRPLRWSCCRRHGRSRNCRSHRRRWRQRAQRRTLANAVSSQTQTMNMMVLGYPSAPTRVAFEWYTHHAKNCSAPAESRHARAAASTLAPLPQCWQCYCLRKFISPPNGSGLRTSCPERWAHPFEHLERRPICCPRRTAAILAA